MFAFCKHQSSSYICSGMPWHSRCEVRGMHLHDIFLLHISAILSEAISNGNCQISYRHSLSTIIRGNNGSNPFISTPLSVHRSLRRPADTSPAVLWQVPILQTHLSRRCAVPVSELFLQAPHIRLRQDLRE